MTGEFPVAGVFLPSLLIWALAAFLLSLPLRWGLDQLGLYRFVWHRGLFDLCLMVLLLGLVTAVTAALPRGLLRP